jgi:hypothetical protein
MSVKKEESKIIVNIVKRVNVDFELAGLSEDKIL